MSQILAADRIPGMMPAQRLGWLGEHALHHSRIVEVGCWRGRSTRALCDNSPGTVTAVDTWKGSPELADELRFMEEVSGDPDWLFHEFQRNLADCRNLEVLRLPSLEAAAKLKAEERSFDMIFLDALHDYLSVRADISAWFPLVSPGGILCGDDFHFSEVRQAVVDSIPGFPVNPSADLWVVTRNPDAPLRVGELKEASV